MQHVILSYQNHCHVTVIKLENFFDFKNKIYNIRFILFFLIKKKFIKKKYYNFNLYKII